jgi:hypothetical protein
VLRQAALLLVAAAVLTPAAAAGPHGRTQKSVPPRVVVRTELVPASSDGFDWLDAAAGFGVATVLAAGVLLAAGHRLARN